MRQTVVLWLVIAAVAGSRAQAGTIYVTPSGTGGGTSWADATSLTNALRTSFSNDAIWLAQGIYASTGTFTVAGSGVALYGGFTTAMSDLAERDWNAYPAILSGNSNNWRVVTVSGAGVVLDGLVITNSYGTAAGGITKTSGGGSLTLANCRIVENTANNGGGVYVTSGALLITNCVVAGNKAYDNGGYNAVSGYGLYATVTTLDIVDCLFSNQYARGGFNNRDGNGGAICFNSGVLRVSRTDFINNRKAPQGGGGAVYIGSGATLSFFSNCVFRGNSATDPGYLGGGGALYVGAGSSYTANVVNCTFTTNTAGSGGAIYLNSGALNLKNSILWTNRLYSGNFGSEIYQASGTLRASYNAISGLGLPYVYVAAGSTTFANCMTNNPLFASATDLHVQSPAGRWDGTTWVTTDTAYSPCIDAADASDPVGSEPSENGNRRNVGAYGGTAQASKSPSPAAAPQVTNRAPVSDSYTRMILRGELTNPDAVIAAVGICYGTNSVAGETTNGWQYVTQLYPPQQTGVVFTVMTPYLLTSTMYYYRAYATNAYGGSWAPVDSFVTDSSYPPGWGVGGGANVIHVKSGAVGEADGRDWYNAYPTIAAGIAAVSGSRTNIWVAGATYSEGLVLTLANACTLIGGFAGTESAVAGRALTNALGVVTNYTVINGENSHAGVSITASGAVYLEALKCTNAPYSSGNGGINKSGSGLLVMNDCQLVNNGKGGYISAGSVLMTNCLVANNRDPGTVTGQSGFGLLVSGASTILDLVDCLLTNNYPANVWNSRDGGGAALCFAAGGGVLRVLRTSFLDNQAAAQGSGGGAVYVGGKAFFSNCVFRGNSAPGDQRACGAAMAVWSGAATASVVNCTFAYNTNAANGGAIYVSSGTLNIKNSIFWTNGIYTGYSGSEIYATNAASRVNVSYSDFTGTNAPYVVATGGAAVQWGLGMLTADPLFASATDVHLKSKGGRWNPVTAGSVNDSVTSPCIDAGDPADPVGQEPEPNGRKINMGAYGGTLQASRTVQSGLLLIVQ